MSRYLAIGLIACAAFTWAAGNPPKAAALAIPLFFEPGDTGAAGAPSRFDLRGKSWSAVVTPASLEVRLAGSGAYRMAWVGADRAAAVQGLQRLPGVTNYFVGNDASKWRTGIPQFQRVEGIQIYHGVNVDYYSSERDLEYDVHIAPHVSPARLRMRFDGVAGMRLNGEGDLTFQVGETRLTHRRPTAYQWRDGRRVPVPVSYQVGRNGQVGFAVGKYDRNLPLVIDPVLSFSTYLGGAGDDVGQAIAVDSAGFVYVIGSANTSGFEFLVAKLNPATSQIVYLTYLGSPGDMGTGIAVDASGQAYITGSAGPGFPLVNPLPSMSTSYGAVVAKLSATGALIFSTLIAGSGGSGGNSIALDSAGNIYVVGYAGPGLPVKNPYKSTLAGGLNAFVAKVDNSGSSLLFATYLGGSGYDGANAVAVDPSGNVYVAGYTSSTDFPLVKSVQGPGGLNGSGSSGFVAELDSTGSNLLYSTYLGSGSFGGLWPNSAATGIAADAAGNAYVAGWTDTQNFPLLNPLQNEIGATRECFVSKFSSGGALAFSTLFGSLYGECAALALDSKGRILIAGFASNADLPLVDPWQTDVGGAGQVGFVTMLDNGGSQALFSSILGPATGQANFAGVAADASGAIYVTGKTLGSGYPLARPAQSSTAGEYAAVVSGIQPSSACTYQVSPLTLPDTPLGASPTYTITVTAPAGCVWNAVTHASHMHLAGADWVKYLGSGNGSVQLVVEPYTGGPDSTAEAVVAGQRVATTLKGSCTFSLNPVEITLGLSGGPGAFDVIYGTGCTYTATTSDSWISIGPPGSGVYTSWVKFLAAPSTTPREGAISVNGVTFAVHQNASGTSSGITSPAPGSQLTGPTATFTWTLGRDYSNPFLCIGSTLSSCSAAGVIPGPAGSSLAFVDGLPVDGSTVHVIFDVLGPGGYQSITYTYTAAVGVPNPAIEFNPVTPSGFTDSFATFTFTAWDTRGASELTEIYAWFTPSLSAADSSHTCMFRYEPKTSLIYLQGDDGKSWSSLSPGSSGNLNNSQCAVNMSFTSGSLSGNLVTLEPQVTFTTAFGGVKQIGMHAVGAAGDSGPWQKVGDWTVPGPYVPPRNVSVSPNAGSGPSGRFVFTFAAPSGGFSSLSWVWMWFKTGPAPASTADLTNSCLISYSPPNNVFGLYSDSAGMLSGGAPGGAGHAENSRCSLNNHTSSAVTSAGYLTITLDLTFFTPLFAGPQNIWMRAVDGEAETGLQKMGTWTVASTSGITLATSPNPSAFGQAVTLTATVTGGGAGNVTFYDGSTVLGTVRIASGAAALSTILLPAGKQELRAYYSGDASNPTATSNIVVQTVNAGGASGLTAGGAVALPSSPSALTMADFNGDGKADLAVATSTGVSVLLGNGDGTFRTAGAYLAGAQPSAVAAGDFNGDGRPDLAVANLSSGDISVLLGDGAGGFLPAISFAVGSQPRSVAIGDFNGDGKADLAVANSGSDNLSILLGNGDGTFGPAQAFPAGSQPYSVVVGDFNDDGNADLAVADSGAGCVSILLGKGDGTFQAPVSYGAGTNPHSLAVFHAVGYAEAYLAVANFSGNVSVLVGAGDGTFYAPQNYAVGAGASSLVVADFNGDGNPDVATADFLDAGVGLLMNVASPPPAARRYSVGHGPISVAVGDFDGDGRTDIAVADATDHVVNILLSGACTYSLSSSGHSLDAYGYAVGPGLTFNVNVSAPTCPWSAIPTVTWLTATPASGAGNGTVAYYVYPNSAATPRTGTIVVAGQTFTVTQAGAAPLALSFVPMTPCRVVDTRNTAGPFGGPAIAGSASRDFNIPSGACSVPSFALAFSLNVAVVPAGPLGYLTLWPTGQTQPLASTLNSLDGRIKSNAAIVPAGTSGNISVFASNATDVILDINGYFVPASVTTALAFYPITPCRIADTRTATAPLGGPSLDGGSSRTFPIQSSACGLPATAQAYSLNLAAAPPGPLGYLTAWPTGQTMPLAASLNALTGTVTANAAIVPAGTAGSISVFASNPTDLVIDVNGYFAPMATGGLSLYGVTPCRVEDTRLPAGSPPITSLDVAVSASACGIPTTAQAYVLSVTAVPPGPLGYMTLWPQGQAMPVVSTLNALDGAVTSNLAIVPTTNGSISVFPSNPTHVVMDISGYFGP